MNPHKQGTPEWHLREIYELALKRAYIISNSHRLFMHEECGTVNGKTRLQSELENVEQEIKVAVPGLLRAVHKQAQEECVDDVDGSRDAEIEMAVADRLLHFSGLQDAHNDDKCMCSYSEKGCVYQRYQEGFMTAGEVIEWFESHKEANDE